MSVRHLAETTRNLVQGLIQTKIQAALAGVISEADDTKVNLEPPQSYFNYPTAKGYKTPTIFTVIDDFDFRPSQKGANHINALVKMNVSALVEDRQLDRLVIKTERYLDALHNILANTQIVDTDKNVKLVVIVSRASFSPEYQNNDQQQTLFRKEVVLECEVEHYSNF